MCQIVKFAKSEIECSTVKELKAALPGIELINSPAYTFIDEDSCLCQIDLDGTFDNAGIKYERDWMRLILTDL